MPPSAVWPSPWTHQTVNYPTQPRSQSGNGQPPWTPLTKDGKITWGNMQEKMQVALNIGTKCQNNL